MKTYLVFEPAGGGRDAASADRVMFVQERFRWAALLFAPLWLLWHRLWLAFALWLVAEIALGAGAYALGLDPQAAAPVLWLPTLVIAFEGTELLRRKLLRRGYREAAVMVANDIEEAERRFFAGWQARAPSAMQSAPSAAPAAPMPFAQPAASNPPVIGLFPQPRGRP